MPSSSLIRLSTNLRVFFVRFHSRKASISGGWIISPIPDSSTSIIPPSVSPICHRGRLLPDAFYCHRGRLLSAASRTFFVSEEEAHFAEAISSSHPFVIEGAFCPKLFIAIEGAFCPQPRELFL